MGVFETQDAYLDSQLLAGAPLEPEPILHVVNTT